MNELQTFSNSEFGAIRTLSIDNAPWFVGRDVAIALGYNRSDNALRRHVEDEDKLTHRISASGQNRNMVVINESGLYSLILSSKLPNAKKFKRWVTSEVLPAIRKTGFYSIEPIKPAECDIATQTAEKTIKEEKYMRAAQYISTCPKSNLPLVLSALHEAGVDLVLLESAKVTDGECARLINKAVNDYGLSMTAIGRLVGLQTTQISRIRSGESTPSAQRSKVICDAIRARLPEIE